MPVPQAESVASLKPRRVTHLKGALQRDVSRRDFAEESSVINDDPLFRLQ